MKYNLPIAILASAFLASNVEARWQPQPGITWDYLLGASDSVVKASTRQAVTIDLDNAPSLVPHLHKNNQKVICYFSGGTMQKSRVSDYNDYVKAGVAMTDTESGWGNHYIDVRKLDKLKPLIGNRMKKAKQYGCDGVEVDSLGVYTHVKRISEDDCYNFAKTVAEIGHNYGLAVGLKNVPKLAERLDDKFDFAVVESCAEFNECGYYTGFTHKNKAVFTVHYGGRVSLNSSSDLKMLVNNQKGHGFSCVFSQDKYLTHNAINYDCNTGKIINGKGYVPKEETKKTTTVKKTTTTVKKTTTTVRKTTTTTTKQSVKQATPAVNQPVVNKPSLNQPVVNKPALNQAVNQPVVNKPAVNQPVVNKPAVNQPVANKPVANKPITQIPANQTVSQNDEKTNKKEVSSVIAEEDVEEGGNGAAAFAVVGSVATAAVAGFVFLKKNKKFNIDNFKFSTENFNFKF